MLHSTARGSAPASALQNGRAVGAMGAFITGAALVEAGGVVVVVTVSVSTLGREQPKSPYIDQANLAAARAFVDAGELDKASARLKTVMEQTPDHALALVARERLARVQIAQNAPDAALATLAAVDPGSFAPRYHEVRADAFEAKKDFPAALKEYRAARAADGSGIVDPESLDLKIGDLVADERAPSAAAVTK